MPRPNLSFRASAHPGLCITKKPVREPAGANEFAAGKSQSPPARTVTASAEGRRRTTSIPRVDSSVARGFQRSGKARVALLRNDGFAATHQRKSRRSYPLPLAGEGASPGRAGENLPARAIPFLPTLYLLIPCSFAHGVRFVRRGGENAGADWAGCRIAIGHNLCIPGARRRSAHRTDRDPPPRGGKTWASSG